MIVWIFMKRSYMNQIKCFQKGCCKILIRNINIVYIATPCMPEWSLSKDRQMYYLSPSLFLFCSVLEIAKTHRLPVIWSLTLTFQKKYFYLFTMKYLQKWRKMLFISCEKLFSFSRYLWFCLDFLACRKNGLIRKIGLTSKFMTSEPG